MKIISIVNQKGGVGKTSSAVNIANGLGKENFRVLLVDADPQGDTTHYSGAHGEIENGVKELLISGKADIIKRDNYDLIGTDIELADAELQLISEFNREYKMKKGLKQFEENYDYCIIDCPPSLSLLTLNALVASHISLSPVLLETFSIKGVNSLLKTIEKVQGANEELELKLFVNKYDARLKHNKEYLEQLKDHCEGFLMKTIVRTDSDISKSQTKSQNINEFNEKSKAAEDFSELVKELING